MQENDTTFRDKVTSILAFVIGILVLAVVGYGLFLVRSYIPIVAYIWLIAVGIIPVVGLIAGITYLARLLTRFDFQDIGQYGTIATRFNRLTHLPPMMPTTPKIAGPGAKSVEITPVIPRLGELIAEGTLINDNEGLMLQGFRADTTPRYGTWPGVIGVAGMQNVGKSVTIETLAIIALMQHAQVIVCDTHHRKARSLYKKLEALEGYITFAKTEEQVLTQALNFSQELKNRKNGSETYPLIFILDEAASVIRSKIGDEIVTIIEEASQEGHGYNLHLVLAIHDFSKDGLGDARIRDFLNWIYCHRMQQGQSKFIEAFKGKLGKQKTSTVIASLPVGHCVAKDEVNDIEYLIMPNGDSRDALIARKALEEMGVKVTTATKRIPENKSFVPETVDFNEGETSRFIPGLPSKRESETVDFNSYEGRKREVKRLRSLGFTKQGEVLQLVWKNVKPGETQEYKDARAEYQHILEELIQNI